jgi:hypothetical protein
MYRALRSKYPVDFASHVASFTPFTEDEEDVVYMAHIDMISATIVDICDMYDARGNFIEWLRNKNYNGFVRAAAHSKAVLFATNYYFKQCLYMSTANQHRLTRYEAMIAEVRSKIDPILPPTWFSEYMMHRIQLEIEKHNERQQQLQ